MSAVGNKEAPRHSEEGCVSAAWGGSTGSLASTAPGRWTAPASHFPLPQREEVTPLWGGLWSESDQAREISRLQALRPESSVPSPCVPKPGMAGWASGSGSGRSQPPALMELWAREAVGPGIELPHMEARPSCFSRPASGESRGGEGYPPQRLGTPIHSIPILPQSPYFIF